MRYYLVEFARTCNVGGNGLTVLLSLRCPARDLLAARDPGACSLMQRVMLAGDLAIL